MGTKALASLVGDRAIPKLAVELTSFSSRNAQGFVFVGSLDTTGALTEVLALTGKFEISMIVLASILANDLRKVKLTIDGVVVWNEVGLSANSTTHALLGQSTTQNWLHYLVEESLSLELECATDTSINLNYHIRPIL